MVRLDMEGNLLDWGERPFGFNPVAWDGERLWALDPKSKRIHQVEKSESGRALKPKRKGEPKAQPVPAAAAQRKEAEFEYGFRHDPVRFVENDKSLQGAMVRTFVFEKPKPDDKKLIQAEIDKILAAQLPDGKLSDDKDHALQFTAQKLIRVAELGCPASRPEVQKAIDVIVAKEKPNKADPIGIYDVRAFCLLGIADRPDIAALVRNGLQRTMERETEWSNIWEGCPWTPIEHLITLWHGREHADIEPTLAKALAWIADGINDAGCLSYKDPWGFVRLAATIDHPLAREIAQKEVPMLLRAQGADGGWGDKSFIALRALKRHGLFDKLRGLPPLPDDWRTIRSIPAPEGSLFTMTWGGGRLWVYDKKANQAIAVSPDHGKVLKTAKLPVKNVFGIGWWDDALAVTLRKPKKLLQIDPDTGKIRREVSLEKRMEETGGVTQLGDKLWIADGFMWSAFILDEDGPANARWQVLGCPTGGYGTDLAAAGDGVWHFDRSMPMLAKSSPDGRLLSWAEKPFGSGCQGVAFDGEQLWALDAKNNRICAIVKTATAPKAQRPEGVVRTLTAAALEVKREGGQVWIERVPCVSIGDVNDDWTALLRGMHLLLTHRGEKATLDEIMACSGDAFSLCHSEHWELRTLHTVPTDTLSNVAKAYGYAGRWIPPRFFWELKRLNKEDRKAASDKFVAQIWREVDSGRPVLMGGTHGQCASWRAVVGYDRDKQRICYAGGPADRGRHEWTDLIDPKVKELGFWDMQIRGTTRPKHYGGWIANTAFLLGEKKTDVPDVQRIGMALQRAVELHNAKPFSTTGYGGVTYYFGAQAYEQWAKDLHELDYPADAKKPRPKLPECYDMSQMWFQADQIVRGRSAAAKLCERAADVLTEAKIHLVAAARAYREEAAIARDAFAALLSGDDEQRDAWQSDEAKREAGVAAIGKMLEKERAAVTEIKKALVVEGIDLPAAHARDFTAEQKKRLLQWENLFGAGLDKCMQGAAREPVILELLALELSLKPISEDAAAIRRAMTELEPADLTYWPLVEAIVEAIGSETRPSKSIKNGKLVRPVPGWAERKQQIKKRARAMEEWLKGTAIEVAKKAEGMDAGTVEEVYGLLGEPNADKKRLAKLTVEKMNTGEPSKDEIEAVRKSEMLGKFAHRIEMLDAPLWSYDHNSRLLLGDIGRGRVTGEWHKPGGPLAWSDGNPAERPNVAAALEAIDAWLAGKESSHNFTAILGKRDAYKEKVWLVRCLHTYLRVHLVGYYAAPEKEKSVPAKVKREGDKVWIEGVERIGLCDFIRALTTAMRAVGEDIDYDRLMGLSGLAFRLQIKQPEWHGSAPDAGCGFDCMGTALDALGYASEEVRTNPKKEPPDNRAAIVQSIDRGVPVVAMDLQGGMDWGVVAGYVDGGKKLLCAAKGQYSPAKKWPWLVVVIGDKEKEPDRRENFIRSLKLAVELANTEKYDDYASGFAAYEAWIDDLTDDAKLDGLIREKPGPILVNARCYGCLVGARTCAFGYLRSIEGEFSVRAAEHLSKAADFYEAVETKLRAGRKHAPHLRQLKGRPWTREMRHAEAAVLKECLALEKQAVAQIEKALAAEGVKLAPAAPARMVGPRVRAGSAVLNDHTYEFRWLAPESLFDVALVKDGKGLYGEACQQLWGEMRRPPYTEGPDAYCGGHVWPLYNLQEDIPAGELKPVDDRYGEFWFELGRGLKGKVKQFGLLAYADGKLAGKIRFYPKTLTRAHWGGWSEEEHRREWRDDILWIGSGYVDPQGIEDALDGELIRRVVDYARTQGFVKIQATGWAEAVPYAMWGESFRASAFRPHGFGTVARTSGCTDAFEHMINGCHGKWCSDLMREAIDKGISCDTGHQCRIVELDLTVPKPKAEPEGAANRLPAPMGETAMHEAARHGHVETAQWLIERGANVNAKDAKGHTPLDFAKTVEMEALLHKHGAKPGAGKAQAGAATRFERSGSMAVIRGLEKMDWGGSFWKRQDSFMACFTEVLRCSGSDVTYAEAMGMSGAAFKLTTGDENWCPSQAICDVGADCPNQALRAFGYSREIIDLNEEKDPGAMERARKAVVESIDRGLPVMYMDGERSLVVGYRDGGKTFTCMPYAGSKEGYKEMPKLRGMLGDAWFVEVLRRDGKAMERRDAIWESLRTAVRLARSPSVAEGTRNGLTAYETWVRKLKNPPEKPNLHGHAYVSSILLTSRQAAADYVRLVAKEVKPDAAEHLRAAADRYESVAKRLWQNRGLMKHPWDKSWTPENRAKEANMMLANLTDERVAVAEIEQAFAAEGVRLVAAANLRREGSKVWIEGVPIGKGNSNRYARGVAIVLESLGTPVDYDTVMGLSGLAFITQAQQGQPIIDGAVDVGWWPLASWGFTMRLEFLQQALGWSIRSIECDADAYRANPAQYYREHFAQHVTESIGSGRPVLAVSDGCFVVKGYDAQEPPLLGNWSCGGTPEPMRIPQYPWGLIPFGQKREKMTKEAAELEALRYAVALFRDDGPRVLCSCPFQRPPGHFTGRKALTLWAEALRDVANLGQARWHANMVLNLKINRRSAVKFLRTTAKGRSERAAEHLNAAAQKYESVLAALGEADTGKAAMKSRQGREKLAKLVERIAELEALAVTEIEKALATEGIKLADPINATEQAAISLKREGTKVWIDGVDRYRYLDPMFEGVRIILNHRGEGHSPEYIQGISGAAFRIGGICPCAPTCDVAMNVVDLVRLLGYDLQHIKLEGKDDELKAQTQEAVARVKQEIDAGRPALVWHAFSNAEWDVVYGYDSEKRQFLGRGSWKGNDKPYAVADEGRTNTCGHICPPQGVIIIGRKARTFDARAAELAALKEAVRHGRSQHNVDNLGGEKWVMLEGIACYDRWICDFKDPEKKRTMGDAYCYGVYHSTRRAAASFLREIAPKYPRAAEHLKRAAEHFETEVMWLDRAEKQLWWNSPAGPDPKRNAEAADFLQKARDAYASGIAEIEKALSAD